MSHFCLTLKVARRFLFSNDTQTFFPKMSGVISGVAMVGVSLGVMALIVVTSVFNGFEGELKRVITDLNGDLLMYSKEEPFESPETIKQVIQEVLPQASGITASYLLQVMSFGPKGMAGALLEGVELETIGKVTALPRRIIRGRMPERIGEVAVGNLLAQRLGVELDSEMRTLVPFRVEEEKDSVLNFKVVGIVHLGMHDYDTKLMIAHLKQVQSFLNEPDTVTHFHIRLGNQGGHSQAQLAASVLKKTFEYPFLVRDWSQLNRNLFYAISLQKIVIMIILAVIVIVASLNIVGTLMMLVRDKTREVMILKVMGLKSQEVFWIFTWIGVLVGGLGIVLGVAGGMGLVFLLHATHWIRLPSEIYYLNFLPVEIRWTEVGFIVLSSWGITCFSTFFPALQVARRRILEGLSYG